MVVPFSLRFRLRSLLVRMCALNALPRLNFPVAVFLKRLAAPRWLFSFGMIPTFLLPFRPSPSGPASSRPPSATGWCASGCLPAAACSPAPRRLPDRRSAARECGVHLRVRHLAAAEEDRRLHLVSVREEALDVLLLELVVVLVHLRPEFDFLDLDDLLVLLRGALPLLLLVLIAPEVHDPAHRRDGRRGNLDQVEPFLSRDGQRLRRWHDAELCSVLVDDADFPDPDPFVHPRAIVPPRTSVKS